MTSTINASTTAGIVTTADTSGVLALQTAGTTAVTVDASQNTTLAGALAVNGNTTLGDASTDTILMTGAPSIGGAGLGMGMGFRNRIINGAMVINQRGAVDTPITFNDAVFTGDRFGSACSQSSKATSTQSSTAPAGFSYSALITSSSAYTLLAGDFFNLYQNIEGFNTSDLAWGTASAATVTLSFWVRSSLTGTFGGSISNNGLSRSYPFTYTISSANTWEQKSITIAGDTTGTWVGATNGIGMRVYFGLGVGSTYSGTAGAWAATRYQSATGATSVVGTNGATWYITGVQLEKGSTATAFDYRPYGTELALAQRYYWQSIPSLYLPGFFGSYNTTGNASGTSMRMAVPMRAAPAGTIGGTFAVVNTGQPAVQGTTTTEYVVFASVVSTGSNSWYSNNSGYVMLNAEL